MMKIFSENLTFLTPWYAHVRVRIRGLEMLVFQNILHTYLMDGPYLLFIETRSKETQSVHNKKADITAIHVSLLKKPQIFSTQYDFLRSLLPIKNESFSKHLLRRSSRKLRTLTVSRVMHQIPKFRKPSVPNFLGTLENIVYQKTLVAFKKKTEIVEISITNHSCIA